MASPSPVPPYCREVPGSAWTYGENSWASRSGAMPIPVSRTQQRSRTASVPSASRSPTSISPRAVNLMALPIRLVSTWPSRNGSPTSSRSPAAGSNRRVSPFSAAEVANRSTTCPTTSSGRKGMASSASWSASSFEKSRMSLRMRISDRPVRSIPRRYSSALGGRASFRASRENPRTMFMGVRISWLISARKSALAWAAASLACSSRSSSCFRRSSSAVRPASSLAAARLLREATKRRSDSVNGPRCGEESK